MLMSLATLAVPVQFVMRARLDLADLSPGLGAQIDPGQIQPVAHCAIIKPEPFSAALADCAPSPLSGDSQEGGKSGEVLFPDALEPGPVLCIVGKVDPPEPGILGRTVQCAGTQITPRPGRSGRLQFPRFAPDIAAL